MPNKNPTQTEEFKKTWYKSSGGDDLNLPQGKVGFNLRFPIDVEATLLEMDAKERVAFMRSLIVKAVRDREEARMHSSELPDSITNYELRIN